MVDCERDCVNRQIHL